MNKNILIGLVAFGGLILVASLFSAYEEKEVLVEEVEALALTETVTSNFPTYPQASVNTFNESINDEGRLSFSISLISEDSIAEINHWYREVLNQNGWSIKSDRKVAGYQIIQGENENLYTSMQAASGEGGIVVISQQAHIRPIE